MKPLHFLDAKRGVLPKLLTVVAAAFVFSISFTYAEYGSEKKLSVRKSGLSEVKSESTEIWSNEDTTVQGNHLVVMTNGSLASGFGMGVNTSENNTAWVKKVADAQVMEYPGGTWGAVFVTIGNPVKLGKRPFKDISAFTAITIELKGAKGKTILIGLKSNTDNDDGSETKVPIQILNNEWNVYTIKLDKFESADTKHIYVIPEFVFDDQPQTITVRNIQFIQ